MAIQTVPPADLLEALEYIRDNGPAQRRYGICYSVYTYVNYGRSNLYVRSNIVEWALGELFPAWPEFSGDKKYPVGLGKESYGVCIGNGEDIWDPQTDYGAARWRLLRFLISELSGEPPFESCVRGDSAVLDFSPEFLSWATVMNFKLDGQPLNLLCNGWEI